jgi:hypothetical protein
MNTIYRSSRFWLILALSASAVLVPIAAAQAKTTQAARGVQKLSHRLSFGGF